MKTFFLLLLRAIGRGGPIVPPPPERFFRRVLELCNVMPAPGCFVLGIASRLIVSDTCLAVEDCRRDWDWDRDWECGCDGGSATAALPPLERRRAVTAIGGTTSPDAGSVMLVDATPRLACDGDDCRGRDCGCDGPALLELERRPTHVGSTSSPEGRRRVVCNWGI